MDVVNGICDGQLRAKNAHDAFGDEPKSPVVESVG